MNSVFLFASLFIFLLLISQNTYATNPVLRSNISKEAEIVAVKGDGWVQFIREKEWIDAARQQALTSGDSLKTGTYGKLDVLFVDGTQIKVNKRTVLLVKSVRSPAEKKGTVLGLEIGEIWSRSESVPEGLKIETPSATAAIRGTDWDIVVDDKGASYLTVLKGTIELSNDFGMVRVDAREQAVAEIGKPPVKMFLIKPRDRVQWIISYPVDFLKIISFYSHRKNDILSLLPFVREKVRKNPDDSKSRLLLAGLLFDMQELDQSLTLFDEVLADEPDNGRALTFMGFILLNRGEIEKASDYFEKALKSLKNREKTEALLGITGVYLAGNEIGKASQLMNEISLSDASPVVGVALASFSAYLGKFAEAIGICSDYARRYPDDERFPGMAGDFYLTLDENAKAKESIDKALAVNPLSSLSYTILGRYYYLEGKGEEAEKSYRKAVEIDPGNADAFSEIGRLLMEKGYYEESEKQHSKAVAVDPTGHAYWSRRGMLMNWVEDIHNAEDDFRIAMNLNPIDYQSIDGLGFIALKEGRIEEAIDYFRRASLLDPGFAEPHIFLAIAYYQKEEFEKALDELRLAETLDPKDPIPHIIAYLIYQDTYRPFDSIQEASRALELLPNLKSVNPVETTQKGLTNLGSALLGLGMTEWAASYAEESFNQFDAASYFFVSQKYETNPLIFVSQNTMGFLLNPISIKYSDRYQDIVLHPKHNLTIENTIGDEDGGFSRRHKLTQQGYIRKPFEMTYLVDFENREDKGFRDNTYSRGNFLTLSYGARPDYKNGFAMWAGFRWDRTGEPGPATKPDPDDNFKVSGVTLSAGYSHRFGHNNYLLLNFSYSGLKQKFNNLDPLGSTGITNAELSFINRFGLNQSIHFFERGVYDIGLLEGVPFFSTDSTGTFQEEGLSPLPYTMTQSLDENPIRSQDVTHENTGFQLRHLFDIGKHQLTYGIEYIPTMRFKIEEVSAASETGTISGFFDEPFLDGPLYFMFDMEHTRKKSEYRSSNDTAFAYISDRWKPVDNLLVEAGVSYWHFDQTNTINNDRTDYSVFYPRVGFEWKFVGNHIVRAAYQKFVYPGATLTLAPLSTAGLFFEWIQLNPGAKITDYQIALESRWSNKIFTLLNVEQRDFKRIEFDERNRTYFFSAALNTIVTDRIGFFARYKYADSENKSGLFEGKAIPLLPGHAFGTGIICVLPSYIKTSLSTYYIADQYGDAENNYKIPDFWVTDFQAMWEPFRKHWMFKLAVNNIFDSHYEIAQGYPAAGRSVFITAEYRF